MINLDDKEQTTMNNEPTNDDLTLTDDDFDYEKLEKAERKRLAKLGIKTRRLQNLVLGGPPLMKYDVDTRIGYLIDYNYEDEHFILVSVKGGEFRRVNGTYMVDTIDHYTFEQIPALLEALGDLRKWTVPMMVGLEKRDYD